MKKALAAILALFYLVAVNGVGVNLHYCCGTLDKVEVSFAEASASVPCTMQPGRKDSNCCKDVHKQFKITQPQYAAPDISLRPGYSFAALLPYVPRAPSFLFSSIATGSFSPHSPPFPQTAVYLRNCSFLI